MRIAKTNRLSFLLRLGREVFTSAKVDAIVTVFSGRKSSAITISDFENEHVSFKRVVDKKSLVPPYAYDWLFSDYVEILADIEANSSSLGDLGTCENACATSDAYKLKDFIKEKLKSSNSDDYFRIINTGTIGRYVSKWGVRKMTYLGLKIQCPVVEKKSFLRAFKNSYGKKSVKPKLIVKGLNLLDASIDLQGMIIPGKTTLVVTANSESDLMLLLCILNSRIAWFYMKEKYPASSYNQGTTFTKKMINELPLPNFKDATRKRLIEIASTIIEEKGKDYEFDASLLEAEVDKLLFKEFKLTEEQIVLVVNR